jgi:hypothetical protein
MLRIPRHCSVQRDLLPARNGGGPIFSRSHPPQPRDPGAQAHLPLPRKRRASRAPKVAWLAGAGKWAARLEEGSASWGDLDSGVRKRLIDFQRMLEREGGAGLDTNVVACGFGRSPDVQNSIARQHVVRWLFATGGNLYISRHVMLETLSVFSKGVFLLDGQAKLIGKR